MSGYRKYVCNDCDHIYDEAKGDPESDIPPGTRWDDLPDDWTCPECGAPREEFELLEPG